ncbi:hypothetical protein ACO0RG_001429 [Hanseniaspora osmophila]
MSSLKNSFLLGCLLPLSNAAPFRKGKTITVTKTVTLQPIHDYNSMPTAVPELPLNKDKPAFEEDEYATDNREITEDWDKEYTPTSTWDDTYASASTWTEEYTFPYTPVETDAEEVWDNPLLTRNAVPQWVTIDEDWEYPATKIHEHKRRDACVGNDDRNIYQNKNATFIRNSNNFKSAYETFSPISTVSTCTKSKECGATQMASVMKSYSPVMNNATVVTSFVKFNETAVSTLTFHPPMSGNSTFGNHTIPAFSTGAGNALHGVYNTVGQFVYLLGVALFYVF